MGLSKVEQQLDAEEVQGKVFIWKVLLRQHTELTSCDFSNSCRRVLRLKKDMYLFHSKKKPTVSAKYISVIDIRIIRSFYRNGWLFTIVYLANLWSQARECRNRCPCRLAQWLTFAWKGLVGRRGQRELGDSRLEPLSSVIKGQTCANPLRQRHTEALARFSCLCGFESVVRANRTWHTQATSLGTRFKFSERTVITQSELSSEEGIQTSEAFWHSWTSTHLKNLVL